MIKESSDLLYHLLVIWISIDIEPEEIWQELSSRKLISGLQEKINRDYILLFLRYSQFTDLDRS